MTKPTKTGGQEPAPMPTAADHYIGALRQHRDRAEMAEAALKARIAELEARIVELEAQPTKD